MTVIQQNQPPTNTNPNQRLPKQFFTSRSSILKRLPIEKESSLYGVDGFLFFFVTYLQIEHWNCKFVALLEKRKLNEKSSNPSEQKPEDSLSVASSSVNIRERKVSFGIMPMQRENSQSGKKKPKGNMWTIVPNNQKNIPISLQRQQRDQKQLRMLKEVLYEFAGSKDIQNEGRSRHHQETSIKIAKILQILFPQDQSYLNGKLFANLLNTETTIPTMVSGLCRQSKDFQLQKKLNFLREVFFEISKEQNPILDQGTSSSSRNNCRKMISNFSNLMKRFGFEVQKDVRILYEGESQNQLKLGQSQGQKCCLSTENSIEKSRKQIGIQVKNGLFTMMLLQDAYLFSLDIQRGEQINESVETLFMNSLVSHSCVQREKVTLEGLQNMNTKVTTSEQFIQRYNNRYFKNQRLIYKQKSKEERFREQQLLEPVSIDNYDGGYQILINSKHSNGQMHHNDSSHQHNQASQTQEQRTVQIRRDFHQSTHFTGNLSLEYTRQLETCKIHELIIKENQRYTFFVEETQFTQQSSDGLVYEGEEKERAVRVQGREKLEEFYSRNDFQISDNEILDDIQRVLI